MIRFLALFLLMLALGCSKNSQNTANKNTSNMEACSVVNSGIFVSDQPSPNGASSKINTFNIDSVVLKANRFVLWFTENGTNERFMATLRRYDNKVFESGKYYFLDSTNSNFYPPYSDMKYPVVYFQIRSLTSTENAFYLYDQYEVCVSNVNGKFGIYIDGIKVGDIRTLNPSVFLTIGLQDNLIIEN